jgi:hypothetical protein
MNAAQAVVLPGRRGYPESGKKKRPPDPDVPGIAPRKMPKDAICRHVRTACRSADSAGHVFI